MRQPATPNSAELGRNGSWDSVRCRFVDLEHAPWRLSQRGNGVGLKRHFTYNSVGDGSRRSALVEVEIVNSRLETWLQRARTILGSVEDCVGALYTLSPSMFCLAVACVVISEVYVLCVLYAGGVSSGGAVNLSHHALQTTAVAARPASCSEARRNCDSSTQDSIRRTTVVGVAGVEASSVPTSCSGMAASVGRDRSASTRLRTSEAGNTAPGLAVRSTYDADQPSRRRVRKVGAGNIVAVTPRGWRLTGRRVFRLLLTCCGTAVSSVVRVLGRLAVAFFLTAIAVCYMAINPSIVSALDAGSPLIPGDVRAALSPTGVIVVVLALSTAIAASAIVASRVIVGSTVRVVVWLVSAVLGLATMALSCSARADLQRVYRALEHDASDGGWKYDALGLDVTNGGESVVGRGRRATPTVDEALASHARDVLLSALTDTNRGGRPRTQCIDLSYQTGRSLISNSIVVLDITMVASTVCMFVACFVIVFGRRLLRSTPDTWRGGLVRSVSHQAMGVSVVTFGILTQGQDAAAAYLSSLTTAYNSTQILPYLEFERTHWSRQLLITTTMAESAHVRLVGMRELKLLREPEYILDNEELDMLDRELSAQIAERVWREELRRKLTTNRRALYLPASEMGGPATTIDMLRPTNPESQDRLAQPALAWWLNSFDSMEIAGWFADNSWKAYLREFDDSDLGKTGRLLMRREEFMRTVLGDRHVRATRTFYEELRAHAVARAQLMTEQWNVFQRGADYTIFNSTTLDGRTLFTFTRRERPQLHLSDDFDELARRVARADGTSEKMNRDRLAAMRPTRLELLDELEVMRGHIEGVSPLSSHCRFLDTTLSRIERSAERCLNLERRVVDRRWEFYFELLRALEFRRRGE